ncbi:PQQ-binding-like beta-propeller repeat protein [Haloarcula sp. S1AR25-5A]|uniref:PQQ-binding-like beta-propeller repeat protein n=1 Tax=Haloarcula terrestris TaxID=2950533 RepID=A0AAE4F0G9_9EURY|nr:PQQ-binding-like beta-propeller repeat protein [Haloarcula terrestris]MDS0223553.1 PQQ-binding-like beta-propeller repeat protein [Haloarcula terrestris]
MPEPTAHEILTTGGWPYAPPVVHDGIAYFAHEREVIAVTPDGSERWSQRLEPRVSGAPALDPEQDRLYVPTRVSRTPDGPGPAPASVTVLSLSEGTVENTLRVGDRSAYGVTVVDSDVYVRSATACVKLGSDGSEHWRQSFEPLIYNEYNLGDSTATQVVPAVTGDGVYVPDRNAIVKLNPDSGGEHWRIPVETAYASPVVDDGRVIQTGYGETVAVTDTGNVRWRRSLRSRATAAVADGDIYIVADDLHELDAETGETNWQTRLPFRGTAAPVVTDDSVIVVTGSVHAFNRDTGGFLAPDRARWQTEGIHAAAFASPVVAAGRLFVVSPMGLLSLRSEGHR